MKRILLGLSLSNPRRQASDGSVWAEPSQQSEINHKLALNRAVAAHLGTHRPYERPAFREVIRAFGVEDTIPAQRGFDSISMMVSTSLDALRWLCKIELTPGTSDGASSLPSRSPFPEYLVVDPRGAGMNSDDLRRLIQQDEGLKLDFKQEFYKLDYPDPKVKKLQKGELIKDVLALADGNVGTAGLPAHLVIGVGDVRRPDGTRELFDVGDINVDRNSIVQMVNDASSPGLVDIQCEIIRIEEREYG